VIVRDGVYDALMQGPEHVVELFHGYTYSGHPLAAAAGLATLAAYREEDSFARARSVEPIFEEMIHSLRDEAKVVDIRNIGLMGGIELAPRTGAVGARGFEVFLKCFEAGVVIRNGGDVLQFSPFLDSTPDELGRIFDTVRQAIRATA